MTQRSTSLNTTGEDLIKSGVSISIMLQDATLHDKFYFKNFFKKKLKNQNLIKFFFKKFLKKIKKKSKS